jgi:GNAT superfamily N-acetyltransferase
MQLDDILEHYPKTITLKDASSATLRPLESTDEKQFHQFFVAVPANERILFKHRVTELSVIREWCQHIDYGRILPLLALSGDKPSPRDAEGSGRQIVADASLHQTLGGWKRHIGRISVVVHPEARGKGLAKVMVGELVHIARDIGLEKLEAEFLGNQVRARRVFAELGFNELLVVPDYVKDMQAISHDYVLMGRDLITDEDYTSAAG